MAWLEFEDIKISGITAAVPKHFKLNKDYDKLTSREIELQIKTTGVEKRHLAPTGMATSDLCFAAAEKLISELKWQKEEIGILIFVSQSPDYYLPATSIILQDRLGLSQDCMAFDIGLGCSGFVYGMSVISSLMQSGKIQKGLLLCGDISSATCSEFDKSTHLLFGDGGTATALEFSPVFGPSYFQLNSDGSNHKAIMIKDGGLRNLVNPASFEMKESSPGVSRCDLNLQLEGLDVFNFSVTKIPPSVNQLLEKIGSSINSIDFFIFHQGNKLMNETIRKKLKIDKEIFPYSLGEYGNTSSASIPITIIHELRKELNNSRKTLLCSGFGVGLSWANMVVEVENLVCPEIILL